MQTDNEAFNEHWNYFINAFRGKLKRSATKQQLTLPLAKLILTETALMWTSEYELAGRWLSTYCSEHPDKSEQLRQVLIDDMELADAKLSAPLPSWMPIAVAGAGGLTGLAVARYALSASRWVTAASALVPILILYPTMRQLLNRQAARATSTAINTWVSQLNKNKEQALAILSQ